MSKKNEQTKSKEAEEGSEETNDGSGAGLQEAQEIGLAGGKEPTEKEKLLALHQTLKDLGINSIGDLEVKISRL